MNRRELLKNSAAAGLYVTVASTLQTFLNACNSGQVKRTVYLSDAQYNTLQKICDIIIPETKTPGALSANVPVFAEAAIKECITPAEQKLDKLSTSKNLNDEITKTDTEAFKDTADLEWYKTIKRFTCIGYFTSQQACTTALNYKKAWGSYKGCIPYKPGDKQMAKNYLMYY
jgi:hypothetical protein